MNIDIFISGGGVAGLAAAAAFGAKGWRVLIVDPAPPITTEKELGADLRTTAFLQPARAFLDQIGLWDRLAPHATPLQTMAIVDASATPPIQRAFESDDISDLPFGWNLPNWLLRREFMARLSELETVEFRAGVGFQRLLQRSEQAAVWLSDGTKLGAQLVIGADGRTSPVRAAAGIDVKTKRYGQKAITFAVTHDQPHDNVSTEVHRTGGPFTLVPLPDRDGRPCSAVVWMESGAEVARLLDMNEPAFSAAATERSAEVMGALTLASRRTSWPIISQVADRLSAERVALVAEAAHVLPPIGAQGLNMSLADLACLIDLTTGADDPGATNLLDQYEKRRHPDIKLRVTGIDALNRASIGGGALLQDLRRLGLRALHDVKPVRKSVMQLGLGTGAKSV